MRILPILLMMNNYFHDLATGLLVTSGIVLLVLYRIIRREGADRDHRVFSAVYRATSRIAAAALVLIVLGGIPRTIFFADYEWWDAASKGIVAALIIKHLVVAALVIAGLVLWFRIRRALAPTQSPRSETSPSEKTSAL